MTAFELYFCVTVLRGALAVLFLLAAGSLLRDRLPPGLRRMLWLVCLMLMLIPQMNFSASPFRLDLSELRQERTAAGMARIGAFGNDKALSDIALQPQDRSATVRALWRHLALHRKTLEFWAIMLLPLPALFLLFARYWRCRRTIRPLPPVTDRRVLEAWSRVLAECGPLPRPVILLDSSGPGLGPTLFGCFNCKLLLPVEVLRGLSDGELGLLLEHEYHHGKAGDSVVNIAALVLWAFAWYNPFMLIARRKLRASCEMECDRKILARHPHAVRQYGNLLLRFVSPSPSASSPVSVGLAESPRELSRRIQSMTAGVSQSGRCGRWTAVLIALALAAPVALVAVNAKPATPHSVAVKPVLPHLVLKPVLLSGGEPGLLQCWELFYPAAFPAGQSSLALEIGKARLGAELTRRPGFLLLWKEEAPAAAYRLEPVSALPFALCETRLTNEPAVARVVPAADGKAVLAALVGTEETAAITLEVRGLGLNELKDYSAVPLYR